MLYIVTKYFLKIQSDNINKINTSENEIKDFKNM